jgi:putative ABC transport system permease protein
MAGLLAGLHPALTAAAQPANLSQMARSANLRGMKALHVLMAVQFAVAIGIAFFALVSYRQAALGRSETALFDDPNVAIVWSLDKPGVASRARAYREAVGRLPGVLAIAETGIAPGDGNKFSVSVRRGAVDTAATAELMNVGDNLFGLLGIRPLAGRVFSAERTSDHFPQDAESAVPVVINLTAVHQLGFESSEAAIGQSFQQTYGKGRTWRSATIIGVVPDFHFRSPFSKVEQTVFVSDPDSASRLLVKFADTQTNTLAQLSGQWDQMFPALPFDGEMLAEALARQYQSVRSSATLMALGTCLALLTAALGTFGLAAVAIGRYTREVAIRRILGAERRDIFRYFGLQFTLPVLAGSVIACPIAFYFAHRWLQSFDQRITLSPALFVVATLVALVLAWLAVSVHVIRVCNIRAAAALRTD